MVVVIEGKLSFERDNYQRRVFDRMDLLCLSPLPKKMRLSPLPSQINAGSSKPLWQAIDGSISQSKQSPRKSLEVGLNLIECVKDNRWS